ncbi:flagellar basal body-associated FliL family protein [Thalassospiraceae bacterium LMO-JJ14]|nr:flagellar basal body-associated FliL family protein [Thalassospiraceae bacterium LMO-JJ14]
MAEEDEDDEVSADGGGEEAAPSGSGGKKKLLIIIIVVILLVLGGLAGAYFTGLLDPVIKMIVGEPDHTSETVEGEKGPSVFYELPSLTVNLNTAGRKARFIKIQVSLELELEEDKPKVEAVIARVMDNFNVYLRELRVEDLDGSAGMYRLREELLTRIRAAVAPVKVRDILFKEMLIQ